MDVLAGAILILAITLGALTYVGYGVTRLLLPLSFRSEAVLWMPFVGYTLLAIVFHFLNISLLDGGRTTIALLIIATAVNVFALRARGSAPLPPPSWRVVACVAGVFFAVYLLGVAPLFKLGNLTAIGKSLDIVDVYDATASYAMDYPLASMVSQSPPNPLVLNVTKPSTLSNGWGYAYLQVMSSLLTGRSPIETQAPTMSLVHALMVPALFVFLSAFRWRWWLSLAAAAGLGLHPLILAFLLQGLGNHMVSLATLPLVLMSTLLAINKRTLKHVVFAGFMLTNIPLSYWVTFPYYLAPIAAYLLFSQPLRFSLATLELPLAVRAATRTMSRQLAGDFKSVWAVPGIDLSTLAKRGLAFAAIVAVSIPLGAAGYHRVFETLAALWTHGAGGDQPLLSNGWGQTSFEDITTLPGMSYWVWPQPPDVGGIFGTQAGAALIPIERLGAVAVMGFAIYGLVCLRPRQRALMISLVVAFGSLLAATRITAYYYAYLKTFTYSALVLIPLAAWGVYRAWPKRPAVGMVDHLRRYAALGGATVLPALLFVNTGLTEAFFFNQPNTALTGTILPGSALQLQELAKLIPAGASVLIGGEPLTPEQVSPIALFLKKNPLFGNIHTLESTLDHPPVDGQVPDYGVLAASEDPTDEGFQSQDQMWTNDQVTLYHRGNTVAHLLFSGSDSRPLAAGEAVHFAATPAGLIAGDGPLSSGTQETVSRQLALEIGSLAPTRITVAAGDQSHSVDLAAGLSRYTLDGLGVPADVSVALDQPGGQGGVFLRSISLATSGATDTSSLTVHKDVLMAQPAVSFDGAKTTLDIQSAGAQGYNDTLWAGVSVVGTASSGAWRNLGWWGFSLAGPNVQFDLDLRSNQAKARTAAGELPLSRALQPSEDGDYTATINFWEPSLAQAGWHSPFYDMFKFKIRDGQVQDLTPNADPVLFLPLRFNYPPTAAETAAKQDEASALQAHLPAGASLLLSPKLRTSAGPLSVLARGLPHPSTYADFLSDAHYVEAGRVYDYALLAPGEDPRDSGYDAQDLVWSGADFALYRRGATLSRLDLKQANGYAKATTQSPLTYYVGSDSIQPGAPPPNSSGPAARGQLALDLASLDPTEADVEVNGQAMARIALPGGVVRYLTPVLTTPAIVVVRSRGDAPVYALDLALEDAKSGGEQITVDPSKIVLQTTVTTAEPGLVDIDLHWAGGGNPDSGFFAGLNLNGNGLQDNQWFSLGWWGVPMTGRDVQMKLDLGGRQMSATADGNDDAVSTIQNPESDGLISGLLNIWRADLARSGWQSPFLPIFRFRSEAGQITGVTPQSSEIVVVSLSPPAAP
jgi:hypothetical protein